MMPISLLHEGTPSSIPFISADLLLFVKCNVVNSSCVDADRSIPVQYYVCY